MKVVHILPGSGGTFYCENCLRDAALVRELRRRGEDMILVPMYLPLLSEAGDLGRDTPVFFGGINVYLQQVSRWFRSTPRWLDRLFDSSMLLRMAAQREGTTSPRGMGPMTLSMLRGEDGNQAKELKRLTDWLAEQERPDLVHVSTSMLLGVARGIKEALDVPVVCTMQDEDVWIDNLGEPYVQQCWDAIRERTEDCDGFVAPSRAYRDAMCTRLGLPHERVAVVPVGIDTDGYGLSEHSPPPTIGYLSKLTPELGLDLLVSAFMLLKQREGLQATRLMAMGGINGKDRQFVVRLERRLRNAGMSGDAMFMAELDRDARIAMLKDLSVMSVPMPNGEAFGTFILEAWASGVPVVQPRVGGFPELVESVGGGVVYDGDTPEALADALEPLLRDAEQCRELGKRGRAAVDREYTISLMADRMISVYAQATERFSERRAGDV